MRKSRNIPIRYKLELDQKTSYCVNKEIPEQASIYLNQILPNNKDHSWFGELLGEYRARVEAIEAIPSWGEQNKLIDEIVLLTTELSERLEKLPSHLSAEAEEIAYRTYGIFFSQIIEPMIDGRKFIINGVLKAALKATEAHKDKNIKNSCLAKNWLGRRTYAYLEKELPNDKKVHLYEKVYELLIEAGIKPHDRWLTKGPPKVPYSEEPMTTLEDFLRANTTPEN